jgi:hypothetical protein
MATIVSALAFFGLAAKNKNKVRVKIGGKRPNKTVYFNSPYLVYIDGWLVPPDKYKIKTTPAGTDEIFFNSVVYLDGSVYIINTQTGDHWEFKYSD